MWCALFNFWNGKMGITIPPTVSFHTCLVMCTHSFGSYFVCTFTVVYLVIYVLPSCAVVCWIMLCATEDGGFTQVFARAARSSESDGC